MHTHAHARTHTHTHTHTHTGRLGDPGPVGLTGMDEYVIDINSENSDNDHC